MRMKGKVREFFFAESDPSTLGVFRIVFGIYLAVFFIALAPHWATYYGPGGVRPEPVGPMAWSILVATQSWIPIQVWWWIGILSALAFIVGWRTRLVTLFLFVLQSSMNHADPMVINGEDLVIRTLLFYGLFAPLGARFSLDSRATRHQSNPAPKLFPAWPVRLMQINIALIYLFSLPLKLASDAAWRNGEAMYWVMMTSLWHRFPMQSLFYHPLPTRVLTFSALAIEGLFPLLVWFRRTRLPALATITLFHIALGTLLQNVTFFSFSMICSFIVFIPAEELSQWVRALRPEFQSRPPAWEKRLHDAETKFQWRQSNEGRQILSMGRCHRRPDDLWVVRGSARQFRRWRRSGIGCRLGRGEPARPHDRLSLGGYLRHDRGTEQRQRLDQH